MYLFYWLYTYYSSAQSSGNNGIESDPNYKPLDELGDRESDDVDDLELKVENEDYQSENNSAMPPKKRDISLN